jgi:hypothetical protein
MSEAASELHSSRPRGSQSRQKSLFFNSFFNDGVAEQPFRLAKFTACRKKCGFLSAQRHKVKAPDADKGKISMQRFCVEAGTVSGDHRFGLQVDPRLSNRRF